MFRRQAFNYFVFARISREDIFLSSFACHFYYSPFVVINFFWESNAYGINIYKIPIVI